MAHEYHSRACIDLETPVRLRYFYGQLLDVYHFNLEQSYFNAKRRLLNRLVIGYGVVCGLDVQLGKDGRSIVVLPGVAIDKCGREIVVPTPSEAQALRDSRRAPAEEGKGEPCDEGDYVHVALCYHECESDPTPAFGGECEPETRCVSGAIRERYEIVLRDGKVKPPDPMCHVPDVASGGRINYAALAMFVSKPCASVPGDCCIPLANVRLPDPGKPCGPNSIDITVRPIVYTNDLLYALILTLMNSDQPASRSWKP